MGRRRKRVKREAESWVGYVMTVVIEDKKVQNEEDMLAMILDDGSRLDGGKEDDEVQNPKRT